MTATISRTTARRTAAALATTALAMGATTLGASTANAVGTPAPASAESAARTSGTAGLKGVDYAAWQREVKSVIDGARPYVTERTANARREKQAVVLDIDNSSLETDFHWSYPTPAIEPVLELTRYAHARGAAVFFVTARPGLLEAPTEYNLRRVGYPVSGLYVRHLPDLFRDVSTYKTAKRAEIEAQGYKIIANIGNNTTDLAGGHAERTFKLPDYDGKLS
ncbi:HAD family acid phosphatase [Streptomyces albireticuli]|uniref:Hydrolase n=1 Tax=Streptomyces albireticuli TaxID=1940 RepID=A0A2A2D0T7_9ACTN|nr:HAD family acid phosphatase [Streptomyces albireticuli]MCD9142440.1 hydrolase [Streptomyces albireticuli]MCD9163840.1 hydrolase [Streptomyces albireticuli]MCD9192568.1 hydrolase [Streptomyces albireticuli]PAU46053.1 hydrolase [Streptomyces albireticuli]